MPRISKKAKKEVKKFTLDCSKVEDDIINIGDFEKFLHDKIKVNGKTGQLTGVVGISSEGTKITVETSEKFSKRYLKYLAKKFLKKTGVRDWLRVVATNPTTYELRYFNVLSNDDDEE